MEGRMFHQDIKDKVMITGMGFCDYTVKSEDGEDLLPPGYYLNLTINENEVAIPVDMKTNMRIQNALIALPQEGDFDGAESTDSPITIGDEPDQAS